MSELKEYLNIIFSEEPLKTVISKPAKKSQLYKK